jgi:hydroxymethylbilane synthase
MLPAPGQGALAIQCRDHPDAVTLVQPLDHLPSRLATHAERAFLSGLGGGCATPVAAYGTVDGGNVWLRGRVVSLDGSRTVDVSMTRSCAAVADAMDSGTRLAQDALAQGAADLIGAIR